eukprot:1642454-Rhodomonas_salina.1
MTRSQIGSQSLAVALNFDLKTCAGRADSSSHSPVPGLVAGHAGTVAATWRRSHSGCESLN